MTQKELLYVEDAIGHEKTILAFIAEMLKQLKDQNIQDFMKKEEKSHQQQEKDLTKLLEEMIHE